MTIQLRSPTLQPNGPIPARHARDRDDRSPPLAWDDLPAGTREIAVTCTDPDAPSEGPFVHWILYGIPPQVDELPEGAANVGIAGRNGWDEIGYGGPQPPSGDDAHHYHFRIYALDTRLDLPEGADLARLNAAMAGHVLDEGELVGTFER